MNYPGMVIPATRHKLGYPLVDMKSEEEVEDATEALDRRYLGGRNIIVRVARLGGGAGCWAGAPT